MKAPPRTYLTNQLFYLIQIILLFHIYNFSRTFTILFRMIF